MSKIRPHSLKSGFTIIELIAVIVVLGICLAPFGLVFSNVMTKYATPEAIQIATALAGGEMERITGLPFNNIAGEGPISFVDFPNYSYQVSISAYGSEPLNKYKLVKVIVSNNSLGISVNLDTIVTLKQKNL